MTKPEWKEKLIQVILEEPGTGEDRYVTRDLLLEYLNELEDKSDEYYGISHEIVGALEHYLDK